MLAGERDALSGISRGGRLRASSGLAGRSTHSSAMQSAKNAVSVLTMFRHVNRASGPPRTLLVSERACRRGRPSRSNGELAVIAHAADPTRAAPGGAEVRNQGRLLPRGTPARAETHARAVLCARAGGQASRFASTSSSHFSATSPDGRPLLVRLRQHGPVPHALAVLVEPSGSARKRSAARSVRCSRGMRYVSFHTPRPLTRYCRTCWPSPGAGRCLQPRWASFPCSVVMVSPRQAVGIPSPSDGAVEARRFGLVPEGAERSLHEGAELPSWIWSCCPSGS